MKGLADRLEAYERVIERHDHLLDIMRDLYHDARVRDPHVEEFFNSPYDVITGGPTIEQRREMAQAILPRIFYRPYPLQIYLPEPIEHRRFGNPLRWYANNLSAVHPDHVTLVQLVDYIGLVYDIVYNSWDIRFDEPEEIPVEKRERIGGDNDLLAVWTQADGSFERERPSYWEFGSYLRAMAGFHRRGVQSVVSGFATIKLADFSQELSEIAGYVIGKPSLDFSEQHHLPLSYATIAEMLDVISTIGEDKMGVRKLEHEGLKKLASRISRITDDLVVGSALIRT